MTNSEWQERVIRVRVRPAGRNIEIQQIPGRAIVTVSPEDLASVTVNPPEIPDSSQDDYKRGLIEGGCEMSEEQVTPLWFCNFWDGPLSGVCVYQNQVCGFFCVDIDSEPRKFTIHRLSTAAMHEAFRQHEVFRRCVGTHTDYPGLPGNWKRDVGAVRPEAEWAGFYEQKFVSVKLNEGEKIGEFE